MIHHVSCVSAVQRFILSPDVVGLYQIAQSAVTSVLHYGRLYMCHVKCLESYGQLRHYCERLWSSI